MFALSLKLYSDAQEIMSALECLEDLELTYTLTPTKDSDRQSCLQCDFFFEYTPRPLIIERIADALSLPAKTLVPKSIAPQDWLALSYDRSAIYESRYFYFTALDNVENLPEKFAKRPIVVNAAHAFGTGGHMSTKLAIDLIEDIFDQGVKPKHIVDFGCGSGILSICSAALWPEVKLSAFDCMPESVEATRQAFEHNPYELKDLNIMRAQDLPDVLQTGEKTPPDLILANILPSVLKEKASQIADRCTAGACVILSGIIDEKADEVRECYEVCGFEVKTTHCQEGWTAFLMIKA